jgi:hypothetical protein
VVASDEDSSGAASVRSCSEKNANKSCIAKRAVARARMHPGHKRKSANSTRNNTAEHKQATESTDGIESIFSTSDPPRRNMDESKTDSIEWTHPGRRWDAVNAARARQRNRHADARQNLRRATCRENEPPCVREGQVANEPRSFVTQTGKHAGEQAHSGASWWSAQFTRNRAQPRARTQAGHAVAQTKTQGATGRQKTQDKRRIGRVGLTVIMTSDTNQNWISRSCGTNGNEHEMNAK